ncbi:hypothetical protein X777_00596, partial [Ooceraea biroi]
LIAVTREGGETGAAGGDRRRRRRRCSGGAIMCTRRILGLAVVALLTLGGRARAYTNQWAAHIDGGEGMAKQVAEDYGFRYLGKVSGTNPFLPSPDPGLFLLFPLPDFRNSVFPSRKNLLHDRRRTCDYILCLKRWPFNRLRLSPVWYSVNRW